MRKTLVVAVALLAVPWLALVALVMAVGAARAAGGADCGGRVVPVDVRGSVGRSWQRGRRPRPASPVATLLSQ